MKRFKLHRNHIKGQFNLNTVLVSMISSEEQTRFQKNLTKSL